MSLHSYILPEQCTTRKDLQFVVVDSKLPTKIKGRKEPTLHPWSRLQYDVRFMILMLAMNEGTVTFTVEQRNGHQMKANFLLAVSSQANPLTYGLCSVSKAMNDDMQRVKEVWAPWTNRVTPLGPGKLFAKYMMAMSMAAVYRDMVRQLAERGCDDDRFSKMLTQMPDHRPKLHSDLIKRLASPQMLKSNSAYSARPWMELPCYAAGVADFRFPATDAEI